MAQRTATRHTMTMEECVEKCNEAYEACLQTVNYCVAKGGDHANAHHIRVLTDCAEICRTSVNFMVRGSQYHGLTCFVCAEICLVCVEECERFAGDETMQECARICRECAQSCRAMAAESGITVEYHEDGGVDYGEAFEEVAQGAQREGKTARRAAQSDS